MPARELHIGTKDVIAVVAVLAAGAYGAWVALHAHPGRFGLGARWTDGAHTYAELADVRYAVWDDPAPLAGDVRSAEAEGRAALSPDGRLLVFEAGERGLGADLYAADVVDGEARDARPIPGLDGAFDELAPAFGPDALYFASDRASPRTGAGFGLDLWRAPYADGVLGMPEPVPGGINTAADETDPLPVPATGELIFASNRARGLRDDFELYLAAPPEPAGTPGAERAAWSVAPILALASPFDEREPGITSDGRVLVFASDRAGPASADRGGFDLYRSVRADGRWLPPAPLDGLNGPGDDRAPLVSPDGFSLTYRRGSGADADLWRARSRELFRLPPRAVTLLDLLAVALLLLLALLALLAKRWPGLEVLYKCFLVSCLLHLLILWYLRHVHPESEPAALGDDDRLFRVRVERPGDLAAGTQDRPGELAADAYRTATESAPAAPDLERSFDERALAAAAPAARALDRAAHQEALPGRDGAAPEPSAPHEASIVRLADADAPLERKRGEAPALAVSAGPAHAAPAPTAGAAPERGPTPAAPAAADSAPAHQALARGARPADALPAPSALAAAPARRAPAGGAELELRRPAEALARDAGPVAGLALPAVASRAAPPRDAQGPERARAANPTAVSADAGDDALPRERADGPLPREAAPLAGAAPPASAADDLPARPDTQLVEPPRGRVVPELALRDRAPDEPGAPTGRPREAAAPPRFDALRATVALERPTPRRSDAAPASLAPERFRSERDRAHDPAPAQRALAAADAPPPADDALPPRLAHTPYKNRFGAEKEAALELYGGTAETEAAVAAGLAYLASIQRADGSWGEPAYRDPKYRNVAVGKTGLALLAFLGAGHVPGADTEHAGVAARAVALLLGVQDPASGHFGDTSAYSHGIATYALAECYALTQDPHLSGPLERAVARIVAAQEHTRDPRTHGGWGYFYPEGELGWRGDRWPRVSVTAWQVMALESARLGGLAVPQRAFDDARAYLAAAWDAELGAFRYSHDPGRLRSAWRTLPASTPAAVFALSLLGVDANDPALADARRFVVERAPRRYRRGSDDGFVQRADGNLYFWYYATLATFRTGGRDWERWNVALQETLLGAQEADGSWEPISVYAEFAGDDDRDRSYTTAMCVLSLEVYYRYFTPLLLVR